MVTCFIYNQIPGAWKGWTLAVFAAGRRDADTYMRNVHHGGKFVGSVPKGGTVKADCGATTSAAQQILHDQLEKWLAEE